MMIMAKKYLQEQKNRINTNVFLAVGLFAVTFIGIILETRIFSYIFVSLIILLSIWLMLSIKKDRLASVIFVAIGTSAIITSIVIPTDFPITAESLDPKAFSWDPVDKRITYLTETRESSKYAGLFIGMGNIVFGFLLAYKPDLLYIKNRPTNFDE
jgi:hypothetical protein